MRKEKRNACTVIPLNKTKKSSGCEWMKLIFHNFRETSHFIQKWFSLYKNLEREPYVKSNVIRELQWKFLDFSMSGYAHFREIPSLRGPLNFTFPGNRYPQIITRQCPTNVLQHFGQKINEYFFLVQSFCSSFCTTSFTQCVTNVFG